MHLPSTSHSPQPSARSAHAHLSGLGALALAAVCPVLTILLASRVLTGLEVGQYAWTVDHVVGLFLMTLGVLVGAWLSLWLGLSALCLAAAAFGARARLVERLIAVHGPKALRRLLATAIGLGLSAAGAPAFADDVAPAPEASLAEFAWVTSEQEVASAEEPAAGPSTPSQDEPEQELPEPKKSAAQKTTVVQPGDSLWRIAAEHLPRDATAAQIAAEWPRWHALNQELIGSDPNLLHPGQELQHPVPQQLAKE